MCFISYPNKPRYTSLIAKVVEPTLRQHDWDVVDARSMQFSFNIHDQIVATIRKSDLFLCEASDANPNVCYELGLANAWGKASMVLSHALEKAPFDVVTKYPTLLYSPDQEGQKRLRHNLGVALMKLAEKRLTLANPELWRYVDRQTSISIEVLSRVTDPITLLDYGHRVFLALQEIEPLPESRFQEIRISSFGAWISANLESVTKLVDTIVFFIPEWKTKRAKRMKIEAETRRIEAETRRTEAETRRTEAETEEIQAETKRKNVFSLLDLVASFQKLGITRLTIGGRLSIELEEDGTIRFSLPPKTDDPNGS